MKKTIIRLTENDLHQIIREAVNEMGTPKQNAFLRKLMGDRYKDEYDNLPTKESSKMIDAELNNQPPVNNGFKYLVVDTNEKEPKEFNSFREAKKYFDQQIEEYDNLPWGGDVWMSKVSDICYQFCGRNIRNHGRIYIKKVPV